jgi:hypothetical protein
MGTCRLADGLRRDCKNRMIKPAAHILISALVCLLSACASPKICSREISKSDPKASALLAESQRAHGATAFAKVRDVSVRYDGRWASVGPHFQPVLADTKFRRRSEERLLVRQRIIAQEHQGPGGRKMVVRSPGKITVGYNGAISSDDEANRAAALVADAYTMFILGPFYFNRPGVVLTMGGEGAVEKSACDEVLAVLRPGFGVAKEDRLLLSIDRATKQLRRVRMTLNGLETTQGAEVDVTFQNFRRIDGVLWPTEFDERIRVPFDLHAHHWKVLGLDTNRGLRASDVAASGFKNHAARPAVSIREDEVAYLGNPASRMLETQSNYSPVRGRFHTATH